MTCPVTKVYVLCDLEDIPCECCFVHRILELASSYGKYDHLTVRDRVMQLCVPGRDKVRSWKNLRWSTQNRHCD